MTELEVQSIPPAGLTSRVGKLLVGGLQLIGGASVSQHFAYLSEGRWDPGLWFFVVAAFWLLPFVVRIGFRRVFDWGWRPLWIVLGLFAALIGVEALRHGSIWTQPVTISALVLTLYVHLHLGVSHVLAAVAGIDGCEMRVIPYYLSRWFGDSSVKLHRCPGLWTPIDRWEARIRGRHVAGEGSGQ